MTNSDNRTDEVKLLGEKIRGIRIAMMTTVEGDGTLRSRPMATQDMEFDGDLWFFTQASAPKASDVQSNHQINISYAEPSDNRFVSISGTAEIVRDRKKIEELWKPIYKIWFTQGLEDPDLALLKVNVESAEYWDASSNKMVLLTHMAKSLITGERDLGGENQKLDIK